MSLQFSWEGDRIFRCVITGQWTVNDARHLLRQYAKALADHKTSFALVIQFEKADAPPNGLLSLAAYANSVIPQSHPGAIVVINAAPFLCSLRSVLAVMAPRLMRRVYCAGTEAECRRVLARLNSDGQDRQGISSIA